MVAECIKAQVYWFNTHFEPAWLSLPPSFSLCAGENATIRLFFTEKTLKLWQVRTRINKNREGCTRVKELDLKNVHVRVPGQCRLAISRLWVPNLDGEVPTAAGNSFSIGAQRQKKRRKCWFQGIFPDTFPPSRLDRQSRLKWELRNALFLCKNNKSFRKSSRSRSG